MSNKGKNIDVKDRIVSNQTHGVEDITCGGSLSKPLHRLSEKIDKSVFQTISMIEPTEASDSFVYRDEDGNVMVSENGEWKPVVADNVSFEHIYSLFEDEDEESGD